MPATKVALGWGVQGAMNGFSSTIRYVGEAHWPAVRGDEPPRGSTITIVPPSGMAAGDFVVVVAHVELNYEWSVGVTGGQTWSITQAWNAGETAVISCRFTGSWSADPTFTHDGYMNPASIASMYVFRGVHPSSPWSSGPTVTNNDNGQYTEHIPLDGTGDWTTAHSGALAIGGICTKDQMSTVTVDSGFRAANGSGDIYWTAYSEPTMVIFTSGFTMAFAVKPIGSPSILSANMTFENPTFSGLQFRGSLRPAA